MSISGIASSILSGFTGSHHVQTKFEQSRDEFKQLGQDLQSGNLAQAQQDYAAIQQTAQQNAGIAQSSAPPAGVHHHQHHHHVASSQESSFSPSSSQQTNLVDQAFSQLAQTLQSGNLQGAQQAFSALQTDLRQIGGFVTSASATSGTTAAGSLNVIA